MGLKKHSVSSILKPAICVFGVGNLVALFLFNYEPFSIFNRHPEENEISAAVLSASQMAENTSSEYSFSFDPEALTYDGSSQLDLLNGVSLTAPDGTISDAQIFTHISTVDSISHKIVEYSADTDSGRVTASRSLHLQNYNGPSITLPQSLPAIDDAHLDSVLFVMPTDGTFRADDGYGNDITPAVTFSYKKDEANPGVVHYTFTVTNLFNDITAVEADLSLTASGSSTTPDSSSANGSTPAAASTATNNAASSASRVTGNVTSFLQTNGNASSGSSSSQAPENPSQQQPVQQQPVQPPASQPVQQPTPQPSGTPGIILNKHTFFFDPEVLTYSGGTGLNLLHGVSLTAPDGTVSNSGISTEIYSGGLPSQKIVRYSANTSTGLITAYRSLELLNYKGPSITLPTTLPEIDELLLDSVLSILPPNGSFHADDGYGNDITSAITFSHTQDENKPGIVHYTFKVTNLFHDTATVEADFQLANPRPVIVLTTDSVTIPAGSPFVPLAYVRMALDTDGNSLLHLIQVSGEIDTQVPGTYTVYYNVSSNDSTALTRTLTVTVE